MDKKIKENAEIIWDYLHLHQTIEEADLILVMGSSDLRVIHKAIELYRAKVAPIMIVSGKFGELSLKKFAKTEAETFAEVAQKHGVSVQHIYLENEATNTGENVILTQKLIKAKKLASNRLIFVGKDYMERRIFLTAQKYWQNTKIFVTSPNLTIEDYCNDDFSYNSLTLRLAGEIDRLLTYPQKGYINKIDIPVKIISAKEYLLTI